MGCDWVAGGRGGVDVFVLQYVLFKEVELLIDLSFVCPFQAQYTSSPRPLRPTEPH